jgi:hypothetical protein
MDTYKLLPALLLLIIVNPMMQAQEPSLSLTPGSFIVWLGERQTDLSPQGVSSMDCIVVRPDGGFHIEHRTQQLPSTNVKVSVSEGKLTGTELEQLQEIIDRPSIREMAQRSLYNPPRPIGTPVSRANFVATISRDTTLQSIYYQDWSGRDASGSTDPAAPTERAAEQTLQPLVTWFQGVEHAFTSTSPSTQMNSCTLSAQ